MELSGIGIDKMELSGAYYNILLKPINVCIFTYLGIKSIWFIKKNYRIN